MVKAIIDLQKVEQCTVYPPQTLPTSFKMSKVNTHEFYQEVASA